jgi:serine/threonine protein phosphatase PrpC
MDVEFWGATDIGCVRKRNEDNFLIDRELSLVVVADGIGGQHRGDIAAALACRVVRERLRRAHGDLDAFRAEPGLARRQRVEERVREAVQHANSEVFRTAETISKGRGMGCTLDAAIVVGKTAFLAHVGDSRSYLVRNGQGFQLTEDHSVIQEKVRRGMMTQSEADKSPGRNVITRAVGALPTLKVDTLVFALEPGVRVLLCTDGITRYLSPEEVAAACVAGNAGSVESLIEVARVRGGVDNITAAMIAVQPSPSPLTPEIMGRIEELRSVALLESATTRELRLVASVVEPREVKSGKLLFREGQAGSELFLLLSGEVVITRNGLHLTTLGPGASFGEMALLDAPVRSASALVTQQARMLVMPRHRFEQLLREDDGVAQRLLWGLVHRLSTVVRAQNQRIGS